MIFPFSFVLYFSKKNSMLFEEERVLFDTQNEKEGMRKCHYPSAVESNGKLYVIATAEYMGEELKGRGAVLFTVELNK